MRKYYYYTDDRHGFYAHLHNTHDNLETYCAHTDAWYTAMRSKDCDFAYFGTWRCFVDIPDTPLQHTKDMYATLSDDIIAALESSEWTRKEVEGRLGVTHGTLLRYLENPWSMPLVHLMSLGDILHRRVVINVLPLEG